MVPFDVQLMGEEAFVFAVLNVYQETTVLRRVLARGVQPSNSPATGEGNMLAAEVGMLMRTEMGTVAGNYQGMYQLVLNAPFKTKTAFADMDPGYYFDTAYLQGSANLSLGTRYKNVACAWHAIPNWGGVAGTPVPPAIGYGGELFSHTLPSLPGPS